jgi:hypothetical protein
VAENRELMDIYLAGTPVHQLLSEIACGDVKIEGAKVRVPPDRFDFLAGRAETFYRSRRENESVVERFLASRCDKEFLLRYIERNPTLVPGLYVMSYFYAASGVEVINRLHEFGLLPESERLRHLASVRDLAVNTPDAGFLNQRHVSFISEEERLEILQHVHQSLLPQLDNCVESWRDNFRGDEDPNSYFSSLEEALKEFGQQLADDALAGIQIADALAKIGEAVEELNAAPEPDNDYSSFRHKQLGSLSSEISRSIFDDVDQ